jgi:SAM-dependent methyltransferase
VTTAAQRWRTQLEAWAIPDEILAAAPESPYGFPVELFRRRAELAGLRTDTPTTLRALEALPERGTVLDVGVGGGATSLPLAGRAATIVGVDASADLLTEFDAAAKAARVEGRAILGRWPDDEARAPAAEVVVCGHVAYNVPELGPFASALDAHAINRVVLELTGRHPLYWMHDLWERFHGLTRPAGPTAQDAEAVLREAGMESSQERRTVRDDAAGGGFEHRKDALALVRRRLCLPAGRDREIADALGDRLGKSGDLWAVGPHERTVVTLWWDPIRRDDPRRSAARTAEGARQP